MAAAPKDGGTVAPAGRLGGFVRVVKEHPLMLTVSILGTIATFIVATARLTDLVVGGGGSTPVGDTISDSTLPSAGEYEYTRVTDDSGEISVEVPTRWGNVQGNGWYARAFPELAGQRIGPGLNASPNVDAWREDLETPGVFIGASQEILDEYTPEEVLRTVSYDGCETTDRKTYANADFTGAIVTWDCEGDAEWRILAATPTESRSHLVYVQAKLVSSADVEAYNKILNTFEVSFEPT
jgi:hypothetical protein